MKLVGIFVFSFAFLMLVSVKASEVEESLNQLEHISPGLADVYRDANEGTVLNRQKRLTCSIDRSLCTGHCILRGYKRGLCTQQKICVFQQISSMKYIWIFILYLAVASIAYAESAANGNLKNSQADFELSREKRFTCNNYACRTNCIIRGFKRGSCVRVKICKCRR
ncbi:sapecin-B [Calliphora vicina]|uniref:sapecin-B n=1 Tax=Calliphora vicina TaxID=7373 RepID=UPI00325BABA4